MSGKTLINTLLTELFFIQIWLVKGIYIYISIQLRMDFTTFVITGPNTVSTSIGKTEKGVLNGAGKKVATSTRCLYVHFQCL